MDIQTLYRHFLQCSGVTTDSRNTPANSLFVALKGDNFNGNAFAAQALESGCRYAVVDEPQYAAEGDDRYLLVENGLQALQQLAYHHRCTLNIPVIGITGTNGKTTTKELIAAVLQQKYRILYTQGNLNNAIGVPLTLLKLNPEHQLAVVEMGASHPGDIRELVEIAAPDYGLITNVGKAHLMGFGSFEGVVRTKGELYDYLRRRGDATIFIDADNEYLRPMAEGLTQVSYGKGMGCSVCGCPIGQSAFLSFEWQAGGALHHVQTQLIGNYNFTNALAAVTIGRYFGVGDALIDKALSEYTPQNNRSQLVQTTDNTLIVDAYNANPTSMMAALRNFEQMDVPHKMIILGDMRELGAEGVAEHRNITDYIAACRFEQVWLVGELFTSITPVPASFRHFEHVDAVISAIQEQKPQGYAILIKGSNSIHLSRLTNYL